ncbi:MAG: glutamate racemase [Bacillota bacterium]|mgnify:CR=1 FL=1|nr:glutamate racemase [Bacillota bacterium]HHU61090.1 glutamate racemase [Natronincola sp.]
MVIGIFDSGLGGLSVWRELRKIISGQFIYFGDTAHVPYGEKSPAELRSYFQQILRFLTEKQCTSVVVACNTSSVVVLPHVKEQIKIPLYGVVEAALGASLEVCKGRMGIIATKATVESGVYQTEFKRLKPDWDITAQSAPRLVRLVEKGSTNTAEAEEALAEYLEPLKAKNIDTLLLGCTHYPFLIEQIKAIMGPDVEIVDPAFRLASQVKKSVLMGKNDDYQPQSKTEFWVSAHPEQFKQNAEKLLNEQIPPVGLHQILGERTECE